MEIGNALLEAHKIVNGERQDQYGRPENSFSTIGTLWTAYLGRAITPHDVAVMLALMKVGRIMNGMKHDNYVDAAAYIALAADMVDSMEEPALKDKE